MELSKHRNYRNLKYLNWLREQDCVIAGRKADVTHHVNLGTNGGKGIKASDYFCLPLLNEFHTSGLWAVHSIGEKTFFETFKLDRDELFIFYLEGFLKSSYGIVSEFSAGGDRLEKIKSLIDKIEEHTNRQDKVRVKKVKAKKVNSTPKVKASETDYYQKSKELKKEYDKVLREKNKKRMSDYNKVQYRKAKEYQKNI